MKRPGANEPLAANAHYAMGNYILMPQMMSQQTPHTSAQPTGQPQAAVTTQSAAGQTAATTSQQQLNQAQFQRQFQQYQPLQHTMGQQLILPQMNAFQMQQFPLLQGT